MRYIQEEYIGSYKVITFDEFPRLTRLCLWLSQWLPWLSDETRFYQQIYQDSFIWYDFPSGKCIGYYSSVDIDTMLRNHKISKVLAE